MSPKSAGLAKKMGYENVRVYAEGEPVWISSGHYTVVTPEFVNKNLKTNTAVVIDLRAADVVRQGHVDGAVATTLAKLEDRDDFPAFSGAAIVFYADKESDVASAIKMIREWGYKNATGLDGGLPKWKEKGFSIKSGDALTKIKYTRQYGPGEATVAEFVEAVESGKAVILDVRTKDEAAAGAIKGSINIPTDDIAARYNELPKNKLIIIHCTTGVRAEMAYEILKEKGYNVKFLKADVEIDKDGKFEISG
ncbi:MAG: rhodanese-like domain-containing protein [Dissulfurispiraceae bacterium]|jgi:rhodanese-related sulfurtransferase|nr:rhodanese-like domain-containing protein [Dissulfurispiraceae bacterium]